MTGAPRLRIIDIDDTVSSVDVSASEPNISSVCFIHRLRRRCDMPCDWIITWAVLELLSWPVAEPIA